MNPIIRITIFFVLFMIASSCSPRSDYDLFLEKIYDHFKWNGKGSTRDFKMYLISLFPKDISKEEIKEIIKNKTISNVDEIETYFYTEGDYINYNILVKSTETGISMYIISFKLNENNRLEKIFTMISFDNSKNELTAQP